MVPDEALIRLEEQVAHISGQMEQLLKKADAAAAMALTLQSHEQKITDHEKDLSGANRALVELKSFVDSTRGGNKVLYWVSGAFWGVGIAILGALFWIILNQNGGIVSNANKIEALRHDFEQHLQGTNK